jgi:hypothetical protein
MLNEGNQIHNFISGSGSGTVINYGSGSTTLLEMWPPLESGPVVEHFHHQNCNSDPGPELTTGSHTLCLCHRFRHYSCSLFANRSHALCT